MPRARREGGSLVIDNRTKSVTAEQFEFVYEGVWPHGFEGGGDREPVSLFYDRRPFDLLADSDKSWHMAVFMRSPPELKLTTRWMESGEPQEVSQTIAL
jgi:hypothetical protein